MQILLFLGAALIFFLLYGMSTSAKTVATGAERVRAQLGAQTSPSNAPVHAGNQAWLQDVKSLFALYQSGALTREEFDEAKRHLLARLKTAT